MTVAYLVGVTEPASFCAKYLDTDWRSDFVLRRSIRVRTVCSHPNKVVLMIWKFNILFTFRNLNPDCASLNLRNQNIRANPINKYEFVQIQYASDVRLEPEIHTEPRLLRALRGSFFLVRTLVRYSPNLQSG